VTDKEKALVWLRILAPAEDGALNRFVAGLGKPKDEDAVAEAALIRTRYRPYGAADIGTVEPFSWTKKKQRKNQEM